MGFRMPSYAYAPIVVMQKKRAGNDTALSKFLFSFSVLFADAVPLEKFDGTPVPIRFGKSGVPPGSAEVPENGINLRQFDVGYGEPAIQAYCFEQQSERFFSPALDPIKLRQVLVRHRIRRFAGDPFALLADVIKGLMVEGEVDHLFAPEGHGSDRISLKPKIDD